MISEIVNKWDKNKHLLEEYFKKTSLYEHSYENIVEKIFELIINKDENFDIYDITKLTILDHGDYQGCQIYILPKNTYQPSPTDYIWFDNYYGSCSGCDTLEGICGYTDKLPDEEETKGLMQLSLDLIQSMRKLLEY